MIAAIQITLAALGILLRFAVPDGTGSHFPDPLVADAHLSEEIAEIGVVGFAHRAVGDAAVGNEDFPFGQKVIHLTWFNDVDGHVNGRVGKDSYSADIWADNDGDAATTCCERTARSAPMM